MKTTFVHRSGRSPDRASTGFIDFLRLLSTVYRLLMKTTFVLDWRFIDV
jgi:hypothetical protein